MTIDPKDHLNRIYAGVLGKLIGVYLGRPFENWRYDRIMRELGPVRYYVNDKLGDPLVVTDDDVGGTFAFPRALEDYGVSADLSAEDIGRAWMNYLVEGRSILWWGGAGNSTEHTAWLNLAKGIKAPLSGSIATNGATIAEQIGAQIFIDGWALLSPGNPGQAAKLARAAGSVSHDGESVHAAVLWAVMEAEAFNGGDVNHLLDTGLQYIPADCLIARLVGDIRKWVAGNEDWEDTRQRIEDNYGYDKHPGNCHVVPNHALMIMALLHAPGDFQRGQMIVNTSGWDTDCNAGNLGCLQGIMLGLEGIDAGPDWRGPVADRLLISTADGGRSITDAPEIALWLTGLACQLAGTTPPEAPKDGATYHFTLPGSVQGFRAIDAPDAGGSVRVTGTGDALAIDVDHLAPGGEAAVLTPVFALPEVVRMRSYDLQACPRVYPGQVLHARLRAEQGFSGNARVRLRLRHYDGSDELVPLDAPEATPLVAGRAQDLSWTIPDLDGQPVAEIGLVLDCPEGRAKGRVLLDRMWWTGTPDLTLHRPADGGDFWRRAWVNTSHLFSKHFPQDFRISQDRGDGMILQGARDWTDYTVEADLWLHAGERGGLVLRAQGQRRFYVVRITRQGELQIARQMDEVEDILAQTPCAVGYETEFTLRVTVRGDRISATLGDVTLSSDDPGGFAGGAMGLSVTEGALSATRIRITPAKGG
ncbi:ADP-ribosylglycohydrolase family protein [Oceaniglobus trochenteri]|uniref:ADP-ribosylglycohydrolase family protein n=1 Tax=Oceaniglobus trochenteri TaxID=2763260 RepID=UPI001CFF84A3|nr:ADP-ribosylglycohydrolase family protein [Oceaniglobus trochenteri]